MFSNNLKNDEDSTEVGEFLNQPSPDKKRKAFVIDEDNDSNSISNILDMANELDSDIEFEKVVAGSIP